MLIVEKFVENFAEEFSKFENFMETFHELVENICLETTGETLEMCLVTYHTSPSCSHL